VSNLAFQIKEKRGDRGLREVANEIGISHATLSRIENGKLPDIETFKKICEWLNVDPGVMLGVKEQKEGIELTFFESGVTTNYFGRGVGLEMLTRDELKKYLEDISNVVKEESWTRMVVIEYLNPTRGWSEDDLIGYLKEVKKDIHLVQKRLLDGASTEDLSFVQKEKGEKR
jgi:transcriptional regulator with XRE-family HTH domain